MKDEAKEGIILVNSIATSDDYIGYSQTEPTLFLRWVQRESTQNGMFCWISVLQQKWHITTFKADDRGRSVAYDRKEEWRDIPTVKE